MAASFISELGDRLGGAGVANTEGSHVKTISAEYYKRNDNGTVSNARIQDAVDAAATKTELSTGLAGKAASTHSHGNITSDGKVGTTANKPLITTTGGAVTTGAFGTSSGQFAEGNHKHSASDITSGTLGVARGGTGITSNPSILTNLSSDTATSVFAASPRPGITGTLSVTHGGTGRTSVAANRFLVGNGSTALVEKTPEQVASLIGADVPPKRKYFVCVSGPADGEIYYYKLATIRCSTGYLDHPFTFEVLTRFRNPFIINFLLYGTNNKTPGVRHFDHVRSIKDGMSRNTIKVGYTVATVDEAYEYTIWISPGSWGTIASVLDTEPGYVNLVTFYTNEKVSTEPEGFVAANDVYLPRSSTLGKGSSSQPIYVDTNGEIQEIGYTIEKSVPSDAVFTDTTYTANNGVSLSGTTFSNSGVRSATINGDYLRVNTNGTNADLTIPYATNAHRLRAAYAEFKNTTGYRLLAEIHPITGTSENTIATFDAFFTSTNNNYSLAHIYVNIRTNHPSSGPDTYQYYWGYIDKKPAYSGTQICAYTKTGSNSLFLFAYVSTASWCGVQLSINQTSDYNGHYRVMDIVDLKHDDTLVASLDSSYTQLNATKSYHNVLAATSQVGSASVPVYIKSNGTVDTCSTLAVDHGGTGRTAVAANNFLVGNGTSALVEKTPEQVAELIGADVTPKRKYFVCASNPPNSDIYYYKLATIRCENLHLDRPFTFEVLTRFRNPFIINMVFVDTNSYTPGVKYFDHVRSIKDAKSRSDIKVGYTLATVDNVYEYTIWVSPGSWGTLSAVLDTEPAYTDLVTFHYNEKVSTAPTGFTAASDVYFPRIPTPGKGGPSQPIYVDTNGEIQEIPVVSGKEYLNLNVALSDFATTAGTWKTARKFTIKDNSLQNVGPQVSVNGSQDVVLTLPATIEASLTGLASRASEAKNLRCCYAAFSNETGYRLMANINPPSKTNACICLFRADFQLANASNTAKIGSMRFFVTVHRNNGDTYTYHWGYLSDWTLDKLAIRVTRLEDHSVQIFANSTNSSAYHSIKLSIESATNHDGTELADDKVILASNANKLTTLPGTELAADANGTGLNVRMNTAGRGSISIPVYVDAYGMIQQCTKVQEKIPLQQDSTDIYAMKVSFAEKLTTLNKGSEQQPVYFYNGLPVAIPINTTENALNLTVMRAINATNAQTAQNALGINGKTIVIGSYGGVPDTIYLA